MWPLLVKSYDHLFIQILGPFLARPTGPLPRPTFVPEAPEQLQSVPAIEPTFAAPESDGWTPFEAETPVRCLPPAAGRLHGLAIGPSDASAAVLYLHGACEGDYLTGRWVGSCFARRGYRTFLLAAPYHLERTPPGMFSGAAMFWSAPLFVAGLAQWLSEVRGLADWLHRQGIARVGLCGYSLGSQTAGLAVTLWPDLEFAVLAGPVGHHLDAIRRCRLVGNLWPWMRRLDAEETALMDRWAPQNRRPLVRRLLFAFPRFDQLQRPADQRAWWRTWGEPPAREYPHGHLSLLFSRQFYRDLESFASSSGAEWADAHSESRSSGA